MQLQIRGLSTHVLECQGTETIAELKVSIAQVNINHRLSVTEQIFVIRKELPLWKNYYNLM